MVGSTWQTRWADRARICQFGLSSQIRTDLITKYFIRRRLGDSPLLNSRIGIDSWIFGIGCIRSVPPSRWLLHSGCRPRTFVLGREHCTWLNVLDRLAAVHGIDRQSGSVIHTVGATMQGPLCGPFLSIEHCSCDGPYQKPRTQQRASRSA